MARYQTKTRTVYTSPEGRVRIDRVSDKYGAWFQVYFDGEYAGNFERLHVAEFAAAMWLHEQAEALAHYQGRA